MNMVWTMLKGWRREPSSPEVGNVCRLTENAIPFDEGEFVTVLRIRKGRFEIESEIIPGRTGWVSQNQLELI
jgi:hypothetical protein